MRREPGREAGRAGHGGGSDSGPRLAGPREEESGGTGDPERTGFRLDGTKVSPPPPGVQGGARGRVQLRGPAGQGSDIWVEGDRHPALGESGGSQWRPAVQTGGGPSRLRGEGRQCCSSRRRPGARAAGSASLPGPTQKLVATNRRPRVPLAASGGVGGRARGRGRLADAAANWWADPESPRKRGRLSAVRQARLCGSGSPLLQRSPWQSPECLGAAQPSAARRQLQPAAPRLRPPSQRLRCPQLHKTSAAARPTAPAAAGRPVGGERPGAGGRRLGRAPREEAAGPRGFLLRSFPPPLLSTHAFCSGPKWSSQQKMAKPSHSSYVLQQLNNQREWGFLCDCCIAIDDIYFQAHKAVLAACSSYFRMFFMNHQHSTAQLNLSNMKISAECFDLILQFMYLGKIMTAPSSFEQFKVAMNYLQLYNVPDCLEDIQDADCSSSKCSSSASSRQNSKMIFGVRMYEDTVARNGNEANRWCAEPSSTVNTPHHREPEEESLQLANFPEPLFDVCKKSSVSKLSTPKERVSRRFGRSFTCDSCGFGFSCEKLLDEHVLTCTNRHSYQNTTRAYHRIVDIRDGKDSNIKAELAEKDSSKTFSAQTDKYREDASQAPDDSASTTGSRKSTVEAGIAGEEKSRATETKRIIIKMEPEDIPADDMKDFNIIKVAEKDCNESTDNDELEDEPEEPFYRYYVEEDVGIKRSGRKTLKPRMSISVDERGGLENMRPPNNTSPVQEDAENASCELCGLTITEEDLSSHYLAKHIENICACGKCGQILVKGRQLQEHAQRCGEPQDLTMNGLGNADEKMDMEENPDEQSEIRDMFVEMLDDFRDNHYQINSIQKKQLFKHSACPFRCPNCGQRFETENLVVEHMSSCLDQDMFKGAIMEENERDHRRKHFCNLCGKGFYQRCHLREHYTVHTKEKQFVCQTCGKQFLRERQLRLHNDMHKGMARYVCSICDQGNFRKHDHVRHMISHLSGGETICQVCFQIFPNNEQLEQHMDVHLYTCGICGAKFNLRKDMRSHYNAKHLKRT